LFLLRAANASSEQVYRTEGIPIYLRKLLQQQQCDQEWPGFHFLVSFCLTV
jgi:hypothetical protein